MKKVVSIPILFVLLLLCGCEGELNTDTRLVLDTFATLTADCSDETLNAAFELCSDYEKLLSKSEKDSEVSRINRLDGDIEVSQDTAAVIARGLYYSELSGGKFDITIAPVSFLWDFENEVVPSRDEIAEALKNVDYEQLRLDGRRVLKLKGDVKIDLGGIAKGYIADKTAEFLKAEGCKRGIVNLGGNVVVFGDENIDVDIRDPQNQGGVIATLSLKNKSVVTSGTYERCFEKNGKGYHHILDSKSGYPVESDLASATVIGEESVDGDGLSTCCILLGLQKAAELIEATPNTEAVFVNNQGKLYITSGLVEKNGRLYLK